jgi:hypothetical protein
MKMATLEELMADVLGSQSVGQTKQASAAKPETSEIDQVLANLGLSSSETVKTASEQETQTTGGTMGLLDIYERIMSDAPAGAAETEKVANEGAAAAESTVTGAFGELVGEYFNVMAGPYFDKVAGDLESEAGEGHAPMGSLSAPSSLGKTIGKEGDPHLKVNREMSNGKKLDVTTGNKSPYSLKEKALLKAILRRSQAGEVGNIVE